MTRVAIGSLVDACGFLQQLSGRTVTYAFADGAVEARLGDDTILRVDDTDGDRLVMNAYDTEGGESPLDAWAEQACLARWGDETLHPMHREADELHAALSAALHELAAFTHIALERLAPHIADLAWHLERPAGLRLATFESGQWVPLDAVPLRSCSTCGAPEARRFCPSCGAPQEER